MNRPELRSYSIGVVIPCRNEARWIVEVLDAVAAQDDPPDDIVVVDDASSDGTRTVVDAWRRAHPQWPVRIIAGPGEGVAAAVNAGIATLATDVIVRFDGHCRPAADYVRRAAVLAMESGIGVAGGVWTIKPSAETLAAEAIAIAVEHPLGSGGALYRSLGGRTWPVGEPPPPAYDVDTVPFGAFRRSLWQELGGLDERLGANEDYEFNFRARQRGLRVVLDPGVRCTYYARPTIHGLGRQYGRYGWWKARMLSRHPTSIRWRQLVPALLVPALSTCGVGTFIQGGRVWPLLLAIYPVAVLIGAAHAAVMSRHRDSRVKSRSVATVGWLATAFFTIQITWSLGFWASLLTFWQGKPRKAVVEMGA